jgi:hypothetical protein
MMKRMHSAISLGVVMAATFVACGGAGGGEGDASCALVVEFRGQDYEGLSVEVAPPKGEPLGSAVLPACDEEDETSGDEHIDVATLPGVSPNRAIVWSGRDDIVLVRREDGDLPSEVAQLLEGPGCDPEDAPITLYGQWLGILGPNGKTELDLEPPYDVDLFVEDASAARYERVFLTVRVPRSLGRPLTRDDVRSSLWEGGDIEVTATCGASGYVAERVRAYPPT